MTGWRKRQIEEAQPAPVQEPTDEWFEKCFRSDAPEQPEERNFCPRCGKRTRDLTAIHTCTPPQS